MLATKTNVKKIHAQTGPLIILSARTSLCQRIFKGSGQQLKLVFRQIVTELPCPPFCLQLLTQSTSCYQRQTCITTSINKEAHLGIFMAEKNCELLKGFGSCHSWKLQQPTEPRSISRHENQKYHPHTRLQNSPYFCVFKYATRAVKQKVWNEAENRERDLGRVSSHKPYGRVRLARFARVRLLRHALPISLLILRIKKNDCFAVYPHTH